MSKKPTVHLVIPQLIQPLLEWNSNYKFSPSYDFLTRFFINFQVSKQSSQKGIDENVFAKLGLLDDSELPVAIYSIQSHLEDLRKKPNSLVCADPVHLEVGLNDITLSEQINDLTMGESTELISLLNDHFKQDGFEFICDSSKRLYLSLVDDGFSSHSLDTVLGKSITNHLPSSNNRNWSVIQNEVQMILHNAPLNQQREMSGLPTVNSLWFWGGGKLIATQKNISLVISDNEQRGRMIAKAAKSEWFSLIDLQNLTENLQGNAIVLSEILTGPAISNDFDLYQTELARLESEVIKPIFEAWCDKRIELIIDSCDGVVIKPIRNPSWKFWQSAPPNLLGLCE